MGEEEEDDKRDRVREGERPDRERSVEAVGEAEADDVRDRVREGESADRARCTGAAIANNKATADDVTAHAKKKNHKTPVQQKRPAREENIKGSSQKHQGKYGPSHHQHVRKISRDRQQAYLGSSARNLESHRMAHQCDEVRAASLLDLVGDIQRFECNGAGSRTGRSLLQRSLQ